MNAYKLETVLTENVTRILQGLPFHAGDTVEVIILERPSCQQEQTATPASGLNQYPLRGTLIRYDDPFKPTVPLEDLRIHDAG